MRFVLARAAASLIVIAAASAQEAPAPVSLIPASAAGAAQDARLADFEALLDKAFATGDFVGLSVAIVRRGETQFLKTWGVTEIGGASVTPDTVFRVGSLSKGFTAALAGKAMSEGLLSPADPATRFAPALKLAGGAEKSLELGHLLSHQTGLPPNAYDNLLEAGTPVADIYAKYRSVKLICPVGKCYSYQNIAFDIAGVAVSSAYGEPYAAALEKRLFAPLGMTNASADEKGLSASGNWARPHVRERIKGADDAFGPWRQTTIRPVYWRVPAAGGVNASIRDMAAWLKAVMGRAPETLPRETLDLIFTPRIVSPAENVRMRSVSPRFKASEYAFGWRRYAYEGVPLIAHSGTVEGYAAQIAFLPEQDAGIVILANGRSKRLWRILPSFLDMELGLTREDWLALNDGAAVAGSK
ncbi:MAG: serine hydrolase domain-containing protein [Parvularculaceae bacterium]|nr:serine hydrolase domain-containing protein [Parvularculaceae bacterium]